MKNFVCGMILTGFSFILLLLIMYVIGFNDYLLGVATATYSFGIGLMITHRKELKQIEN